VEKLWIFFTQKPKKVDNKRQAKQSITKYSVDNPESLLEQNLVYH
jgi:hypothetical protein